MREFGPLPKRKKQESKPAITKYQTTELEKTALRKQLDRLVAAPPAPRLKVSNGAQGQQIDPDHPDTMTGYRLLMEALGTTDSDFMSGLLDQLGNAGSYGNEIDERGLNFLLSVVKGVKPNDQLEAMLAAQMAAVHMMTMAYARRLAIAEGLPQQDSAERAFSKLARTYTNQMEAFKRYRTGGEQTVTVQHVSVSEGGQAIVGNVTQSAREPAPEKPADVTPALTDARKPEMPIIENPERARVPLRRKKHGGRSSS